MQHVFFDACVVGGLAYYTGVAVCCSVLQRVAACYTVLQRVAAYCSMLQHVAVNTARFF